MLIDTHAHLNYHGMAGDEENVLRRASDNGIGGVITIGTSLEGSAEGIATAARFPSQVAATVGIHPTDDSLSDAARDLMGTASALRALLSKPGVVGIGETGLDYFRLPKDAERAAPTKVDQETVFRIHLDLAVEFGLPVVIHQRATWDETLAVLNDYAGKVRTVFHCFGGTLAQAQQLVDLGHLVSFTGIVTFKNGAEVLSVAAALPAGTFMVETDAPYLAPVPHRGEPCEPFHTRFTAETIAKARGESVEELARHTTETCQRFFHWPKS